MQLDPSAYELSSGEVQARFQWALRQGRPSWLWPEVPVEHWRRALGQIEQIIRAMLAEGRCEASIDSDCAAFGLACYTSGMGPMLGWWVERGQLAADPGIAAICELHLSQNRLRAARLEAAAVAVAGSLLDREVGVTILKGMHTAGAYFPEAGTRPAADIDLLVPSGQSGPAEAVLVSLDLVEVSRNQLESSWRPASVDPVPRSLSLVHADDPWSIDLHRSLNVVASRGIAPARLDLARPMEGGDPWPALPGARVLAQPLLLLHLAAHSGAGLHNLTLLRLLELILVIRKDHARISWDAFLELGERTASLGIAYPSLSLCEKLAPGTVPRPVIERCALRAPRRAVALVGQLSPSRSQRVDRSSLAEHFMWAANWRELVVQLAHDLVVARSWPDRRRVYQRRAWQLLHGALSR